MYICIDTYMRVHLCVCRPKKNTSLCIFEIKCLIPKSLKNFTPFKIYLETKTY